eukprot:scaffold4648_cov97-Skeletonema_dohrnii-CCMP3373.AAC.7
MTTEIGSSHTVNNDTSSFAAAELIALLGSDNTATGNNGVDIGKYLSDPTNILNLVSTTTGDTNEALKRELIQSANTTTNNNNNAAAQAPTACVTINNQLTALIPPISREVLQLVEELHLSEVEGLCLYVRAREEVGRLMVGDGSSNGGGSNGGGSNGGAASSNSSAEEEDDFVTMLIEGGRVGFEKSQQQQGSSSSNTTTTMQTDSNNTQQQPPPPSRIIQTARRLFFHERSALLSTVYNLIRHRVEAYTTLVSNEDHDGDDDNDRGTNKSSTSAVLVATDQLVTNGLVDNLIKTVRELTGVMEGIANGLRNGGGGAGAASSTTTATPPPSSTGFGT